MFNYKACKITRLIFTFSKCLYILHNSWVLVGTSSAVFVTKNIYHSQEKFTCIKMTKAKKKNSL